MENPAHGQVLNYANRCFLISSMASAISAHAANISSCVLFVLWTFVPMVAALYLAVFASASAK